MNKLFWSRLHLGLWLLTAFLLPWQTKFILKPALSNYWEISLFGVMPFLFISLVVFFILNFKNLRSYKLPKYLRVSAILFILSLFLSLFYSLDPLLSLSRYLWISIVVVAVLVVRSLPKEWRFYILLSLLISIFLQAIVGISQFLVQSTFSSSILGMALHDASQSGVAVIETISGRYLRAYGPLDHPNVFGGLMALAAIISAYLFIRIRNRSLHLFILATFIVFNFALLTSFSRAAILAFGLGFIVLLIENRKQLKFLVVLFVSSLIVFVFFSFQYQELLSSRLETQNRLEQISIHDRTYYNRTGWESFVLSPIVGTGLSNSTLVERENDLQNDIKLDIWNYQPAHNYWLLILSEGGIILFTAILLFWFFAYQKSRSYRLLALFVVLFILGLFDHWLFSLPLASVLPFFWLALI